MQHNHHNNLNHKLVVFLEWLALTICSIGLLISVYFIVRDISSLHRQGYIRTLRHRPNSAVYKLTPDKIRSWMTFSYITQQFSLPPEYLKTKLNITAKGYPNISIAKLASQKKEDVNKLLSDVQNSIKAYTGGAETK